MAEIGRSNQAAMSRRGRFYVWAVQVTQIIATATEFARQAGLYQAVKWISRMAENVRLGCRPMPIVTPRRCGIVAIGWSLEVTITQT